MPYNWLEITLLLLIGLVVGIGISMLMYCYQKHRCFCSSPQRPNSFIVPALSLEYLPRSPVRPPQEKPYFELCLSEL